MDPGCTNFIQTEREPRVHWAHAHRKGAQGALGSCTQGVGGQGALGSCTQGGGPGYTGLMQTSCRGKKLL